MDLAAQLATLNIDSALRDAVLAQLSLVDKQAAQIKSDSITIEQLTHELACLRRIKFDRTSEALSSSQISIFDEAIDADFAAIQTQLEQLQPEPTPRAPRQASARALPEHLTRTVIVHEPESCQCAQCGGELIRFGVDVSEKLHYTPGTFSVERNERPKYKCKPCARIVTAPVPPAIIDGGIATNALLASIAIDKYVDHLPLYRLEQIAKRDGVKLSRQVMSEWIGVLGVRLQPIVDRLADLMKQQPILHADETPTRQLDPGSGKTHSAYLWAYRTASGPPIVVFDYQTSRAGKHARQFLANWRGHLMVDDYAGYKAMFNDGVVELACWAHARRKFHDVFQANRSATAREALERIGKLYLIERDAKDLDESARAEVRRERALPLLNALREWLINVRTVSSTAIAKAIDYTLKRWSALTRYTESGVFPIDNNPVENEIRPIAVGKKNWLFVGSESSGKRAAAIQSLFATAKANGIEPFAWLLDTLDKLPSLPNSRIDELLPLRGVN